MRKRERENKFFLCYLVFSLSFFLDEHVKTFSPFGSIEGSDTHGCRYMKEVDVKVNHQLGKVCLPDAAV